MPRGCRMPIEVIGFIVLAEDDSSSGFGRRQLSDLRYDRERQGQIFEVREPVVPCIDSRDIRGIPYPCQVSWPIWPV